MNILQAKNIGYKEAEKVDTIIEHLIKTYPIENNFFFWKVFCRTVRSSLDLIEDVINYEKTKS